MSTNQGVRPCSAIQYVRTAIASEDVIQCISGCIDGGCARQGEVLDVVGKGVSDARLNGVDARVHGFYYNITCVVDDVCVITCSTGHRVCANTTIESVVASITDQ